MITLTGESPTRYAASTVCGSHTEPNEDRDEDRGEDGPLRHHSGQDEVQDDDHQDEADQQGETADVGRLEQMGHLDRGDPGQVGVVEVGDELADHQEHEDQAGQPGEGLGDTGNDISAARQRLRPHPVEDAAHEEDQRDEEEQAVHERRGADDRPGDRITQRSARRGGEERDHRQGAEQPVEGKAQPPRLGLLASKSSSWP